MSTLRVPVWLLVVVAALGGVLLSSSMPRAVSEEQPPPKPCDVAVLDVSKVFERFEKFQGEMNLLKKDVESFELVLRQAQKEIAELKEQLEALPKGDEEYQKRNLELTTRQANMQVEMKVKREKFLHEEAGVYSKNYARVQKLVQQIASRQHLRLVLRYNAETINEKDRASVLQGVNRAVVFQDQLDITEEVIKGLNEG